MRTISKGSHRVFSTYREFLVKLNLYISKYPMLLGNFDVYKLNF